MPLSGREKATIFLSILGAESSARILRYLPDELADLIASGINHLPTPSPQALQEVLSEFKGLLALPERDEVTPQLEERPQPRPGVAKRSFAILRYERPQTIAFMISLLPEGERSEALNNLPREKAVVEELLLGLKKNPVTPRLEAELKDLYKEKLFLGEG
jgi:flagellar motor switch protein FliG